MPSKFDDEQFAKSDIVNAPEVSSGSEAMATMAPKEKPKAAQVTVDDETAERNARIFAANLGGAYNSITGKELANDQAEALSELAVIGFSALKGASMPKFLYVGLLSSIFAIPAIPPLLRLIMSKKKEGPNA